MGALNATLDSLSSQSGWPATVKTALVTFDSIGFGFIGNLFVLTIFILIIHAYIGTRPKKRFSLPSSEGLSISSPTNIDQEPKENSPTTEQVTKCIEHLQRISNPPRIKIVSTEERLPFAKQLVQIFQVARYQIIEHEESNDYIFPARMIHNVTLFRHQTTDNSQGSSVSRNDALNCILISLHLGLYLRLGADVREFSSSSNIDYFQIELGDAP